MNFIDDKSWIFEYNDFTVDSEMHRESLLTQGNGYFGTRGAFCESTISEKSYPGCYMAGLYNKLTSKVSGRDVVNEDFVNVPDWTYISFSIDGQNFINIESVKILDIKRQLDIKTGALRVYKKIEDNNGNIFLIKSERFISMSKKHRCAIRYSITSENYNGKIIIRSSLVGDIKNFGVARYRELESQHLTGHIASFEDDILLLTVKTSQSDIEVSEAAKHVFYFNGESITSNRQSFYNENGNAVLDNEFDISIGDSIIVEKNVAIANSLFPEKDSKKISLKKLSRSNGFDSDMNDSFLAWENLWNIMDAKLSGNADITSTLRFHSYHLIVTASPFNIFLDAAVPARGLHGEAYRGHIFWDEMYILPFYLWHFPETAKSLLMYRVKRLDAARKYAAEHGYKGAMFPWQGGSDGGEETQTLHLNPANGEWGDDYSSLQRHVSLAVFYNIWSYYQNTNDINFLEEYGAELLLEVARFWTGLTTFNSESGKYEINGVMGPNEFHEKMPGSKDGGVKDNGYTNIFVSWVLDIVLGLKDILSDDSYKTLLSKINLFDDELKEWSNIKNSIHIAVKDGILAQYDGFLELKELDWDSYRKKYGHIGRMDRILKAEGLSPDDYQLSKQADLLMLFYIFPWEVVKELLQNNNINFSKKDLIKNYNYYLKRTSHGSTLSLIVHSYLDMEVGEREMALKRYKESLHADIDDFHGGTTKEGIHTGLMAGTIVLMIKGFAGLNTFGEIPILNPSVPSEWGELSFSFYFREILYKVKVSSEKISVYNESQKGEIKINNKVYNFSEKKKIKINFGEEL